MLTILAIHHRTLRLTLKSLFLFGTIFWMCSSLHAQEWVQRALLNWNELMRTDLLALRADAIRTLTRGVEEKNDFAIHVGKRSLASYLARNQADPDAIVLLQEAAHYFVRIGDEVLATETYNELGNAHLLLGNTASAIQAFLSSLDHGKSSNDPTSSFLAEVNLAQAYLMEGDTLKACGLLDDYKRRSLQWKKFEAVANAYVILGQIAQAQGKKALSDEYFEKSARYGLRSKARQIRAQALTNLAIVAFNENRKERARTLFVEAFNLYAKVGSIVRIAESMNNLGVFYLETNQFANSMKWYTKSLRYCAQRLMVEQMNDANTGMVQAYERRKDLSGALEQMKKFVPLKDSVAREREALYMEEQELMRNVGIYKIIKDDSNKANVYGNWKSWLMAVALPVLLLITLFVYSRKSSRPSSVEEEK